MTNPKHNGYVVRALYHSLRDGGAIDRIPSLVKQVIKGDMWQSMVIKETGELVEFASFEQFITTPPPEGLGTKLETIKRLCRDDAEALDLIDQVTQEKEGAPYGNQNASKTTDNNRNSCLSDRPVGTTKQYGLRRLRSEIAKAADPERKQELESVQALVLSNQLSVNRALVNLGMRRPTITIPIDPGAAARTIKRHFTQEQIEQLLAMLSA